MRISETAEKLQSLAIASHETLEDLNILKRRLEEQKIDVGDIELTLSDIEIAIDYLSRSSDRLQELRKELLNQQSL